MALCLTYEGLALNKSKTFFLSDRKDLAEINDIGGIKRAEKLKYLGSTLSCDRKQLVRDAKAKCTKFMQYVKGKIQTQNETLQRIIHGAFYRSLIVYHFTPLLGAGVVNVADIERYEIHLARKQYLLPNDIKSDVIKNLLREFKSTAAQICLSQAKKNRLFIKEQDRLPARLLKNSID